MVETIVWHVTARCNYDCRTCYTRRFKGLPELSIRDCLRVIGEAADLGVKHIAFTGGEPFMREEIFELVEAAQKRRVEVSVTTNGSLINDEVASRIRDVGLFLYVSVDGVGAKHELLRPEHSWKALLKSLDSLSRFDIGFATITTLHKRNYADIKEIVSYCKDSGAESSCFLPLMSLGKTERGDVLSGEEMLRSLRLLDEAAHDCRHSLELWCMPFAERFLRNPLIKIVGCRNGSSLDIDASGRVLLCDVLDVVVGDIKSGPLNEVLERAGSHAAAKEAFIPVSVAPCSDCLARSKCLGGCFARSSVECGQFGSPDPLCPVTNP